MSLARKKWRARPLADLVLRQLDPLVAKQGFSEATLLTRWREIVGARVAALCEPARLQWPPRPRGKAVGKDAQAAASERPREKPQEPATLILRVELGFGLDVQHLAPAIVERVNAHLGWRCVARVALRQEPLGQNGAARPRAKLPSDPAARAQAERMTQAVQDDGLRAALARLGESALAKPPRRDA